MSTQKVVVDESSYAYSFKLILIGDRGVGQSDFVAQFLNNRSYPEPIATESKYLNINDEIIHLELWLLAAKDNQREIIRSYYSNSAGAILMYDVTRKETFENIPQWVSDTQTHDMSIIIVGNKSDLTHLREVSEEEGRAYAKENGFLFIETSAMTGLNVHKSFLDLTANIYENIKSGQLDIRNKELGIKTGCKTPTPNAAHSNSSKCSCQIL